MAFPDLVEERNKVTLGNIIESLLGVREAALDKGHWLAEDQTMLAVIDAFDIYVHRVLTKVTMTELAPCTEWVSWVSRLASQDFSNV